MKRDNLACKSILVAILGLTLVSGTINAAETLEIKAEFLVENEFEELDDEEVKKEGWTLSQKTENLYTLTANVPYKSLPIRKNLGAAYFSVAKNGLVQIGISIGDGDTGSETEIQLPQKAGNLIRLNAPLTIRNTGGDYASGAWSIDAKVTLSHSDKK